MTFIKTKLLVSAATLFAVVVVGSIIQYKSLTWEYLLNSSVQNDSRKRLRTNETATASNGNTTRKTPSILVFTLSHPAGNESRAEQRKFCRPQYESQGIEHIFAVGRPSYDDRPRDAHVQGQLANEKEIRMARQLMRERDEYGDILITPNRDHYRDISEKVLSSLKYAVSRGVELILKTDDEYCINIEVAKRIMASQSSGNEIYMGYYQFDGTEYDSMKGADGTIAPFMSGWVFGLTRNLVKTIVEDDWIHSMMFAQYGTSSDDANLGKWVDWAIRTHNVAVDYVVEGDLVITIPENTTS